MQHLHDLGTRRIKDADQTGSGLDDQPGNLRTQFVNGRQCCDGFHLLAVENLPGQHTALYLEDLFVRPERRGNGYGRALLVRLAQIARVRDCGRMEWAVLDWNESAIQFYRKLGALPNDDWTIFRLTRDGIARLAEED